MRVMSISYKSIAIYLLDEGQPLSSVVSYYIPL